MDGRPRAEPNQLLRAARQATASPTSPGFALSRSELAELVNAVLHRRTGRIGGIDGHYVAKLERGVIRWPTERYRQALREVLGAATDSELGFHRPRRVADTAPSLPAPLTAARTDDDRLAWVLAGGRVDAATVRRLREILVAQRHLEDAVGSVRMVALALPLADLVEQLTARARGSVRAELVVLVAECHEFIGRMADYNGDHAAALHHDGRGLSAAREAEDADLVAAVHGLRSHLAWGTGDAAGAIALAEAGHPDGAHLGARVAGFLAQMRGRGHAQRGEHAAAQRLLDRAEQLTERAAEHPEDEPWWSYPQTWERAQFQRGLAYLHLGRHPEARTLLDRAKAALPEGYRRDHGRISAAQALVCAHQGDLVGSLVAGRQAIAVLADTGSVYTLADLRRVGGELRRQRLDPDAVDEFEVALARVTGADAPG